MTRLKVLYFVHNHPTLFAGGAEAYALELYKTLRGSAEVDPVLVARIGTNVAHKRTSHPGSPFGAVNADPGQYFLFTETEHFDFLHLTSRDKSLYSQHLTSFLLAQRPDVVHFQHSHFIGLDAITQVRRVMPEVPIVYTLHEFLPICHRDGQMLRTFDNSLCTHASPRRCHECFPAISPQDFFLRQRFVQSHFENVDLFLAPSHGLRERYVDWGIPSDKIRFEDYGRRPPAVRAPEPDEDEARTNLGFFGQLSYFKGTKVLLKAMSLLAEEEPDIHLWLYGANLDLQTEEFQAEVRGLTEEADRNVTLAGSYEHEELPKLIADIGWVIVPSLWWENSPLVIQEAFLHGRPVICSDIGGMAEKVSDGVNGLHFRVGDPISLARTIRRAVTTPGLWEKLRAGIPDVYSMELHTKSLLSTYHALRDRRRVERATATAGASR
jgi:glycosyltransferase involved in cell wall biosynthesis